MSDQDESAVKVVRTASDACLHDEAPAVFDAEAAKGLDAWQVRSKWPRFRGLCPTCGSLVTKYASLEHYIAGDW